MPDKTTFDVRRLVPGSDADNDVIQATYDSINRLAALVGHVPFRDLLRSPLRSLVGAALSNLKIADRGLVKDTALLERLAERLSRVAGDATIEDLFNVADEPNSARIVELLFEIRRAGIPIPVVRDGKGKESQQALRDLIGVAPDLTYIQLFTKSKQEAGEEVVAAVNKLTTLNLLKLSNDRCCAHGKGHDGIADLCVDRTDSWCNLTGLDGDLCSILSDKCPSATATTDSLVEMEAGRALISKIEIALPNRGKLLLGINSTSNHTLVYHHVESAAQVRGQTTVTCTCWDANGVSTATTKTCPEGSSPLCDCTHPHNPKITC